MVRGAYIVGQVDDLGGTGGCHGVKIGKNEKIQSLYLLNKVGLLIKLITGGWMGGRLLPMI
jgi:hypothetical protein